MLPVSRLCLLAGCVTTLTERVPELSAFELQTQQFSESLCVLLKSGETQ